MDQRAFEEWATARQGALLRAAYLLTGDHGRAEDLVQEALVKVALRWSKLAGGNPEAYARTVIYRDFVSWWRRRRDVVVADVVEHPRSTDAEPRLVLLAALSGLAPRQRAILILRYFEDLTERETAALLGISVGAVKSQSHAALTHLRTRSPELADLLLETR